jgi:hypothetical protein
LHKYVYTHNNPVMAVDPSGHQENVLSLNSATAINAYIAKILLVGLTSFTILAVKTPILSTTTSGVSQETEELVEEIERWLNRNPNPKGPSPWWREVPKRRPRICPPCKPPAGTICYRYDRVPQEQPGGHGDYEIDHIHLFQVNQNPETCMCYCDKAGTAPPFPPITMTLYWISTWSPAAGVCSDRKHDRNLTDPGLVKFLWTQQHIDRFNAYPMF